MTMQGKKKNFKFTGIGKKLLFFTVGLIALTGGVLMSSKPEPDFTTLSGNDVKWQALNGQWVVLNYFAPWCAPCLKEMPQLNQFARALPPNTRLFVINYDPADSHKTALLKQQYNIEAEMIVSLPAPRMPMPPPPALPATYIINPQGQVAKQLRGEVSEDALRQALAQLKSQAL
ncbi:TlpA family protein disulfide reductase [Salinimonas sp. HHU 13199]|uniref:TlpA family protein disulfide reductase n=1 Tax=Salinimonas profundi TaxID=2729140 RepID=A0ABR8LDM2_9ALTE|nr:TlpA disulfide reductase family protein [Salinimonas profundi]MBD3584387.1 TlpA family protein disulfide reductase [Salinimonas profundi]